MGGARRQGAGQINRAPRTAVGLPAESPGSRAEIDRGIRCIVEFHKACIGIIAGVRHFGNEQVPAGCARREVRVRRDLHLVVRGVRNRRPVDREGIGAEVRHRDRRDVDRRRGDVHDDGLHRRAQAVAGREGKLLRTDIVGRRGVAEFARAGRETVAAVRRRGIQRQVRQRIAVGGNGEHHGHLRRGADRPRIRIEHRRRFRRVADRHVDDLCRHAHAVAGGERERLRADIVGRRGVAQFPRAGREAGSAERRGAVQRQVRVRAARGAHGKSRRHAHRCADGTRVGIEHRNLI